MHVSSPTGASPTPQCADEGQRPLVFAVACSGGRDSVALLHACARWAATHGGQVHALHVHHGLNPAADGWLMRLRQQCQRWSRLLPVKLHHRRLAGLPGRGESVEAWARAGRYAALTEMARDAGCELVLLGHHRRDQAETFLLQALRGAGAAGLSSMPATVFRHGLTWARPWLGVSGAQIDAYIARWRLTHCQDDSNFDSRFARNRLRGALWPRLTAAFPEAEAALCAAAQHAQRATALIKEVSAADCATASRGDRLCVATLLAMSSSRRWFALQNWMSHRQHGAVPDAWVQAIAVAIVKAEKGAWAGPSGVVVSLYRGQLWWRGPNSPASNAAQQWNDATTAQYVRPLVGVRGPLRINVPEAGGELAIQSTETWGLPWVVLERACLTNRLAGDRLQLRADGLPRSLKKQFQSLGLPAWQRQGPCLRFTDDEGRGHLLWVAGLGADVRWVVQGGASLAWCPNAN